LINVPIAVSFSVKPVSKETVSQIILVASLARNAAGPSIITMPVLKFYTAERGIVDKAKLTIKCFCDWQA